MTSADFANSAEPDEAAYESGSGYPKLTTSLVNVSLKFQPMPIFLLKKCDELLHCISP